MADKNLVKSNEKIILKTKPRTKSCVLSILKSQLIFIIMWFIMNIFFIYLLSIGDLSYKYWFVSVPVVCFDIIGILLLYNTIAKNVNRVADFEFVLTDKAFYFNKSGKFKQLKRVAFTDICSLEKDNTNPNVFYVFTKDDYIEVPFVEKQAELYAQIAKNVNETQA